MGRRYIGIEMGEHAQTHCQPRFKKVLEGEQGGISKAVNWQGGGGFYYFRLGETIFDEYGAIHPEVRFAALAAHIWFCEIRGPLADPADSPLLGIHNDTAYYLLYNGILGDYRPQGGNVLTRAVLEVCRRITDAKSFTSKPAVSVNRVWRRKISSSGKSLMV
jgi:adenine-specific DNA-methyltransferase